MADPGRALASLPRGVGVIYRHYGAANRTALARDLAKIARAHGLMFLVAGDWRLAAMVRADGLHLPDHATARGPSSGARLWRKQRRVLLTVAAHSPRGVARAHEVKADAVFLAPIYRTKSHPDRSALGLVRAAGFVKRARLPVLALGGVSPARLTQLRAAGFAGIAGIGFAVKNAG